METNFPTDSALMPVGGPAIASAVINHKLAPKSLFDDGDGEMLAIRIDGLTREVKLCRLLRA